MKAPGAGAYTDVTAAPPANSAARWTAMTRRRYPHGPCRTLGRLAGRLYDPDCSIGHARTHRCDLDPSDATTVHLSVVANKEACQGARDDVYVDPTSTATIETVIAANVTTRAINTYAGSRSLPRSSLSRTSA